jgi:hypothetical protein
MQGWPNSYSVFCVPEFLNSPKHRSISVFKAPPPTRRARHLALHISGRFNAPPPTRRARHRALHISGRFKITTQPPNRAKFLFRFSDQNFKTWKCWTTDIDKTTLTNPFSVGVSQWYKTGQRQFLLQYTFLTDSSYLGGLKRHSSVRTRHNAKKSVTMVTSVSVITIVTNDTTILTVNMLIQIYPTVTMVCTG